MTAQTTVSGKLIDGTSGESLVGATALIKGTTTGAASDFEGMFSFTTNQKQPFTLVFSFTGLETLELPVTADTKYPLSIKLGSSEKLIEVIEIKGQRISDKTKAGPLTVESLDKLAIKSSASVSFYEGMGTLKGVDMTQASLGFTIINTRGFNSTSPVRSLQIIDGVDNQSPGLNFSLGNFLGSSELDVLKADLIVGASSAFYGPNAFNGVLSLETKNPFFQQGLAASVKTGERNLKELAIRYAQAFKNKKGQLWAAYKLNGFVLRANDWEADNYDPVYDTESDKSNAGRFDAVNIYGDEYNSTFDQRGKGIAPITNVGLGLYYRTGYKERDLVDYNTKNTKANAAVHFRLKPSMAEQSPELILSSSFGSGTTVYQGDNRFSLRDILFFQNRVEVRQRDKFFIRAYATNEDAGRSFDPYFTALLMQRGSKENNIWAGDYEKYWSDYVNPQISRLGYPELKVTFDPVKGFIRSFDTTAALAWLSNPRFIDSLFSWHTQAANVANQQAVTTGSKDFYLPGTPRFDAELERLSSTKSNKRGLDGGTRLFDRSALYHLHGEYHFKPKFTDDLVVGGNFRQYVPLTDGTIFSDTTIIRAKAGGGGFDTIQNRIYNSEFGVYGGFEKRFVSRQKDNNRWDVWKLNGTVRVDKNQNFQALVSPAASVVWQPTLKDFIRLSFSSAVRNPTLSDQYLFLDVGRAILSGNISGVKNLITVESFLDNRKTLNKDTLRRFNIDPVAPEKVKSVEVGYRTTLFDNTYVDMSYYFSVYNQFIGYQIGLQADSSQGFLRNIQAYRYAANSKNTVTTQGFSIGISHFFAKYFQVSGNYSWNVLNTKLDDPIIPAYNTPPHKFNIGVSGRDVIVKLGNKKLENFGFSVNYKWINGFAFEGSPQFTGYIPTYDLLDGQINYNFVKAHTTLKLGGSNLLNNKQFQAYGGPRIGRMAYISLVYDFVKKNN
ncbi:MAG: TonB-dependent receptor [Saprospiraceae bacterium]|nr:TonB-dependent receptor [Saprospiraceae bacterium]